MTNLFLMVNKDLLGKGLSPIEILIMAQVMEFQKNKVICYLTDEQLAESLGVSKSTVSRALSKLCDEKRFIDRHTETIKSKQVRTLSFNKDEYEKFLEAKRHSK